MYICKRCGMFFFKTAFVVVIFIRQIHLLLSDISKATSDSMHRCYSFSSLTPCIWYWEGRGVEKWGYTTNHVSKWKSSRSGKEPWVRRMSVNSMRGWLALQIQRTICNSANSVDNGNNNDYDDDDESKIDLNSKTYFKLVDGTSSQYILPQVLAASIFMREYNHDIGSQKTTTQQIFSRTLHFLFYCVKWILHVILNFPPLIWFLSKCTAQALVCIMNPESRRSFTIQHKGKQARRKREKPPQQQQQWQHEEMILNVNRLSDFDIIVDPAYLDNRRDYDRIRMSWDTLDQFIIPQWWRWKMAMPKTTLWMKVYRWKVLLTFMFVMHPFFHTICHGPSSDTGWNRSCCCKPHLQ